MEINSLYNQNLAPMNDAPHLNPEQAAQDRAVITALKAMNKAELFGSDQELTFLLDRDTQRIVVRLVDRKTKEVIRQVPSEYILRAAAALESGKNLKTRMYT